MSTGSDDPQPTKITLTYADDEWVARDEKTELTGRGSSRKAALDALDETLADSSVDEPGAIPANDPLFSGRGLFSSDDSFDTADIDDVLYTDPEH
jgi:hypothetical protein